MKSVTGHALWFVEATAQTAREADKAFRDTGCYAHYLYFKPHGLEFAVVMGETAAPEGFELVTGESIPSNRTLDGLTAWVREHTARVPVLPAE